MGLLIRQMAVSVASVVMALFQADRQPLRLAQRLERIAVKAI